MGDGLKMWNVGDFVWTNKSLIHGYICEACVVEGVNSSQDLFDARAETTYASDAVIAQGLFRMGYGIPWSRKIKKD